MTGALIMLALWGLLAGLAAAIWYRRRHQTRRTDVVDHGLPTVSTAQLCREWHESYEALQQAATSVARLRIVMARQRCLDELERRDPEGLNAWLWSNASAAGDPSRFLGGNHSPAPPTDT